MYLSALFNSGLNKTGFLTKTIRIMKLTTVFFITACLHVSAKTYPQKITLKENNVSLQKVFQEIRKQTDYQFLYADEVLVAAKKVTVNIKQGSIQEVLDICFQNQRLTYTIYESTIIVKRKMMISAVNMVFSEPPVPPMVKGKVTNTNGEILVGVSVTVKGTSIGTSTDANGNYAIEAPEDGILVFSYIGFTSREVTINSRTNINIQLSELNTALNEVVVTALGIKKERKSLGYSVTEVKGEDLTQARETNIANSLVGKVAGLNVSSIAGGPGASTNVIIRGISSLGGTNQPLYVVNGVPMESTPNGVTGGQFDGGIDRGDAIGNINPDDIESISVLKGAAASALYGYRAKAGVILITTKSAKGNSIEMNSNFVAETIMDQTDWQYVYGQGANNMKPSTQDAAFQAGQSSWGGKLDGSDVIQFDGVSRPYVAQKDNLKKFYRTGSTFSNTIAFNKTFEGGALRLSANNLTNEAVTPNSGLNRQSVDFTGNFNPIKRLVIDARANYILEQGKNRSIIGDTPGNANYGVMVIANSVDINLLKKATKPDGSELGNQANTFATNPWFAAYKFINNTSRERLIASTSLRYNFDNGLFLQGRIGRDAYNDRYTRVIPTGTAYQPKGSINEGFVSFSDLNIDGLVGKTFNFKEKLSITPNFGGSYRKTNSETIINSGQNFAVPFVYNILNAKNKTVSYAPSDLEVHSLYGTLEIAYDSYLYLTGSARSDWFSTLATPGIDNKLNIVYPSVSTSFIFSEFVKTDWLSFGKLRAGYAVVGQATIPYQTQLSYALNSVSLKDRPLGSISNTSVPNKGLRPSQASELEIGTELQLFGNRIGLDLAWYSKKSKDEIIFAPASISSGYTSAALNIGELQNKGVEALISAKIFKSKSFNWTSSINGSLNQNKVLALAAGQSQLSGGTSRSGVGFTASIVGLPSAQVMAYDYKYDDAGKIVLDANNIPARGNLVPWGSAYSKWIGGWNNEFSYKRFNLSFLIDGKFGGKIFATVDYNAYRYGLHKATLVDREKNFGTASLPIDATTYYTTLAKNVSRLFVMDASFIKFRQLAFGYSFPAKMFNNVVKSLSVNLVARNLFTLMKKTDNIDPEANYSSTSTGLTQGIENGGVPPIRSIGVNLNVKF
jgi:TonB-linked SusC/RagA family outer membrane protein